MGNEEESKLYLIFIVFFLCSSDLYIFYFNNYID